MLATSRLQTILCVTDLEVAHRLYGELLGLPLKRRMFNGHMYDSGGSDLLVCPVPDPTPSEHTVIGFAVDDLAATVAALAARGLAIHRFDHMPHGADGLVTAPDGTRVAWYRDADRNIFSVVQYPAVPA